MEQAIIEVEGLKNYLGGNWVHRQVDFKIFPGEIVAIIGGSGSGKTTILRSIAMLLKPTAGSIRVFGHQVIGCDESLASSIRQRWGMLFQHSALFSAMTVLENVLFPVREFTQLDPDFSIELAKMKINLVGLPPDAADKYPSALSGGMQRRAAAARAIAMDPELLLLDEPTTGLDPKGAKAFGELILYLRNSLGLTIVMVTHDLDLLATTDKVAFIGEGRILALEPLSQLRQNEHPLIREYFK